MKYRPRMLSMSEWGAMFPELVRRLEARDDLAPLLEFDQVYKRTLSGDRRVSRDEKVRLLAGDDGEIYYVSLDE
jgi:hypothetical protein